MTKPPEIKDANKKKLIEHLLSRVVAGVTGRDSADLVNIEPKRAIFSGVLFPLTETDEKQLTGSGGKSEAPPRTAIGFEFKVRPAAGASSLKLVIKPSWAQYYPIFPNWDDVLRSRRSEVETTLSKTDAVAKSEALPAPVAPVKPEAVDILTLPLKFRSVRPVVEAISVSIPVGAPSSIAIGEEQLRAAIAAGQNKAVSDPEIWRHLGEPKQAERRIRGSGLLATKATYEQALAKISGQKAALPEWKLALRIFVSSDSGELRIRVLLANTTKEGERKNTDSKLEEAALFDANLEVKVEGGAITPFEFLLAPSDYRSRRDLFAKGTNCSTLCVLQPEQKITTDTIPVFWQPLSKTKEPFALTFDTLTGDNAFNVLQQLASHMGGYEADWQKYLASEAMTTLTPEELSECKKDKDTFHEEISRLELGIECLKKDPLLFEAFKLMNQAFEELGKRSGGRISSWRLFQLGFIISQLPALAIRNISLSQSDAYAEKLRQLHSEIGILWFPTGGGKTEAYLGLIAVAMLYDRLRGKERGVCTWMRFPLRMLSLQQLERLAKVVAVLNEFREKNTKLKGDCFSIGYFVGGSETTPNSVSGELMAQYEQDDTLRNRVRLMRRCPHCDSEILIKAMMSLMSIVQVI